MDGEKMDILVVNEPLNNIKGYHGSLKDLAYALQNLEYDQLSQFLNYLNIALRDRCHQQYLNRKYKLSSILLSAAIHISIASEDIGNLVK